MQTVKSINIECVSSGCLKIEVDQSHQHEQASKQGVYKKLNGDAYTVLASPDKADKINGDQRKLPEHIKQESVKSNKHSYQRHLHDEDESIKQSGILVLMT